MDKNEFGILDSLEWVFCIVTQNGCSRQPRGAGNRALFLLGFVFGLLLFYSFAAKIVSALVSWQSIRSLQELLDYGKIRWKEINDMNIEQQTLIETLRFSIVGSSFPPFVTVIEVRKCRPFHRNNKETVNFSSAEL